MDTPTLKFFTSAVVSVAGASVASAGAVVASAGAASGCVVAAGAAHAVSAKTIMRDKIHVISFFILSSKSDFFMVSTDIYGTISSGKKRSIAFDGEKTLERRMIRYTFDNLIFKTSLSDNPD
jgi:hypothetical protein